MRPDDCLAADTASTVIYFQLTDFFDVFVICLLVIDNDSFMMVGPKIFCKFQ